MAKGLGKVISLLTSDIHAHCSMFRVQPRALVECHSLPRDDLHSARVNVARVLQGRVLGGL